jgi:hypothetical protein
MRGNRERDPLDKVQRDSNRIMAFTALAMSTLLILVLGGGGYTFYRTQQRLSDAITSDCDYLRVIAEAPVKISGPMQTSRLAVQWIIDSRRAYEHHGCSALAPPSPDLIRLENKYGIRGY